MAVLRMTNILEFLHTDMAAGTVFNALQVWIFTHAQWTTVLSTDTFIMEKPDGLFDLFWGSSKITLILAWTGRFVSCAWVSFDVGYSIRDTAALSCSWILAL